MNTTEVETNEALTYEAGQPSARSARRTGSRFVALLVSLAIVGVLGIAAAGSAAAAPPSAPPAAGSATQTITGTVNGVAAPLTLTIDRFTSPGGVLTAVGTLALADGTTQAVALPVDLAATAATASCDVLNLVLGPLHLDLLGLVIDLNQVVLNITAVPGAGNLLGNLLCAVAGLLDGPVSPAGGLAGLLNRLLGILG